MAAASVPIVNDPGRDPDLGDAEGIRARPRPRSCRPEATGRRQRATGRRTGRRTGCAARRAMLRADAVASSGWPTLHRKSMQAATDPAIRRTPRRDVPPMGAFAGARIGEMLPSVRETPPATGDRSMSEEDARTREVAGAPTPATRDRFHIPTAPDGSPAIYLAGQSLGLQPRTAAAAIATELDAWARLGVDAWFDPQRPWFTLDGSLREAMGRIVGARPVEVALLNSLTVDIHLLLASFFRPSRAAAADPGRRAALPVRPPRPDEPPRPARARPATDLVVVGPRDGEAIGPDRRPGSGHRRHGRRPRARLPGRGQLRHRPGPRHRASDRGRPRRGRGRRLGPGPRRGQHRAVAPRLGRRLRRRGARTST